MADLNKSSSHEKQRKVIKRSCTLDSELQRNLPFLATSAISTTKSVPNQATDLLTQPSKIILSSSNPQLEIGHA
jgi:hypothetical protein